MTKEPSLEQIRTATIRHLMRTAKPTVEFAPFGIVMREQPLLPAGTAIFGYEDKPESAVVIVNIGS